MTEPPITLQEFRRAGYCCKGQREMARLVGVDWRDFARNGIPVEEARKISGIEAMVDDVMKRRAHGG